MPDDRPAESIKPPDRLGRKTFKPQDRSDPIDRFVDFKTSSICETSWGGLLVTINRFAGVCRFAALAMAFSIVAGGMVRADDGGVAGLFASSSPHPSGTSDRASRRAAIAAIPTSRLVKKAADEIMGIVRRPTLYRRLPTQTIRSDADLFIFLTRNPEVLVGMWDLMDITNVQIERTGPYQMRAVDGSGTTCTIDLVYGDPHLHVYVARGFYDGKLTARPIRGSGVFLVRHQYGRDAKGAPTVRGDLDCFLKLDSLGADLVARTFGSLIGKSADHNFRETAGFVEQISRASGENPEGMRDVARRLPQVPPATKVKFSEVIAGVQRRQSVSRTSRTRPPRQAPQVR